MSSRLQVAAVVTFYMFSALTMVFVNKAVLVNAPETPLTFLLLQLAIAVILLHATAAFSKTIEIPKFEIPTAKKLFPVVFVNIVGLVFNTLCLRGVEASFFQIARGLVLPLTITVSGIHTKAVPSTRVIVAALIVTCGFLLGVSPSSKIPIASTPSFLSLSYGVLSSFFIAVHAVLIKSSLPHCGNSTIQLAWWTNVGSAVLLLPVILLVGEPAALRSMIDNPQWDARLFLWGSAITGIFGFLLCIAGLLSIRVTSPITHMFSSAARSVIQTLIGVVYFGDLLTTNRGASIAVILGGTIYFTWVKAIETAHRPSDIESNSEEGELLPEIKEPHVGNKTAQKQNVE